MDYQWFVLWGVIIVLKLILFAWAIHRRFKAARKVDPRLSGNSERNDSLTYNIQEMGFRGTRGSSMPEVYTVPVMDNNNRRNPWRTRRFPSPLPEDVMSPPPTFSRAVEMPVPVHSFQGQAKLNEELPPSYEEYLRTMQKGNICEGNISQERY